MVTRGTVIEDQQFQLVLRANEEALRQGVAQRYVYVFFIDRNGRSTLLFPDPNRGNTENYLPYKDNAGRVQKVTEMPLSADLRIKIVSPFGIDTYMLLTSQDPIPDPLVLQQMGVRTRGAEPEDPLGRLLSALDLGARGERFATPVKWLIASLYVRSIPKPSQRSEDPVRPSGSARSSSARSQSQPMSFVYAVTTGSLTPSGNQSRATAPRPINGAFEGERAFIHRTPIFCHLLGRYSSDKSSFAQRKRG